MADQNWDGLPLRDTSVEPWETPGGRQNPAPKRKKTGLIVGIVAAVVAVAAGVGAYFVFTSQSPEKILAAAWEETNAILDARAAGQPLQAIAKAMEQGGGTFTGAVSSLQVYGEQVLDRVDLTAVSDGKSARVDLNISAAEIQDLDVGIYAGNQQLGFASQALLGSDTFYTLDLEDPAGAARGTIFDPDTGAYPLDQDTIQALQELGEALDSDAQGADSEAMNQLSEEISAIYEEFVAGVEGEKDSGKCPGSGDKATVLTYVYPAEDVVNFLEDVCNAVLDSDAFGASVDAMESMAGGSDLRQEMRQSFNSLRRDYSGDVILTYYVVDGKMAYLELECEPSYQGERMEIRAEADLGLESGELDVNVTLEADGEEVGIRLTSAQSESRGVMNEDWSLSMDAGGDSFALSGSSEWDSDRGDLDSSLEVEVSGETVFSVRGSGTLEADEESFTLEYSDLTMTADGESVSMGLELGYDSKSSDPTPRNTSSFFDLSEAELQEIMTVAGTYMGMSSDSAAGDWDDDYGYEDGWGDGGETSYPSEGSSDVQTIPGYDYMGVAVLNGEEVYLPLFMETSYTAEDNIDYMSDSLSYSVYVYQDYGDTAAENIEWTTDYMVDYTENSQCSDVIDGGNKAARWMREGDYVLISCVEMRGDTAVFVDIAYDAGNVTSDEVGVILEADSLWDMPVGFTEV